MRIDNVKIPNEWADITKELAVLENRFRELSRTHGVDISVDCACGIFEVKIDNYTQRNRAGKKTYKELVQKTYLSTDSTKVEAKKHTFYRFTPAQGEKEG